MRTGAEVRVGVLTLIAVALLLFYAFQIRGYRVARAVYRVCVHFADARGLQRGDPVRMAGVRIGQVSSVGVSEDLRAEVILAVDERHDLYDNYKFVIVTAGIVQERFITVEPGPRDAQAVKLTEGYCIEGDVAPNVADVIAAGRDVLKDLARTSQSLNAVLADPEILTGLSDALQGFSDAALMAAKLAETTSTVVEESQPMVLRTIAQFEQAADNVEDMTAEVRTRIAEGDALADLEATARDARAAAADAARAAESLAELLGDPEVKTEMRAIISAIHDAAQSAKRIGEDLEVLSKELREAAPAVPRVAREADQIAEDASALRERLKPPEIDAMFDVVYSGEADRSFSSANLDVHVGERQRRFFRLGVDDIGEESDVNLQIGEHGTRSTLRYGLIRSELGVGLDYIAGRSLSLSLDVFDPNEVRADFLVDVPVTYGRTRWSALVGARDIGQDEIFVAGARLRK